MFVLPSFVSRRRKAPRSELQTAHVGWPMAGHGLASQNNTSIFVQHAHGDYDPLLAWRTSYILGLGPRVLQCVCRHHELHTNPARTDLGGGVSSNFEEVGSDRNRELGIDVNVDGLKRGNKAQR